MRRQAPFQPGDLDALHDLLNEAHAVVAMQEIHAGNTRQDVIAMRHDVDDNPGALDCAVKLARWEADRGYRSTYYLLHTASWWWRVRLAAETIAMCGHEIGIHADALAHAIDTGDDPHQTLTDAVAELRSWGHPVRGVVGHGNPLCPVLGFANDEQFIECARPGHGEPDRMVGPLKLEPRSLAEFGLDYEGVRLPRGFIQSDSGGRWWVPWEETVETFRAQTSGQLHVLLHPDWWCEAF